MLQRALPLTVFQYRRDRLLIQGVHQFLSEKLDTAATAESVAEHFGGFSQDTPPTTQGRRNLPSTN